MEANILSQPLQPAPLNNAVEHIIGVVLDGGWEHDDLDNPCARIQIIVNAHHMTLVDDTANGWTLEDFDYSPNPGETFSQVFGAVYGDDAEFDYDTLCDFRKTLERVGSERIVKVYGGRSITLKIYQLPPPE